MIVGVQFVFNTTSKRVEETEIRKFFIQAIENNKNAFDSFYVTSVKSGITIILYSILPKQ